MVEEELDINLLGLNIISNVGKARNKVMEALYAAKEGNYDLAEEELKESNYYFIEGHKFHASLIQKEAIGEKVELTLLFMHAEDQLLGAEIILELVKEMIEMYKKFDK
jgi:cellobiose PTS system EIIA component